MILGSRKLAAVAAAVALAAGIGVGAASGAKRHAPGALLKAAAEYVGLSRAELVKQARSGQTLAQIAVARGKTVEGLKAAMSAAFKARLDASVSAGKLTRAQADARLARGTRLIDRIVTGRLAAPKRTSKAGLLNPAARYIGVTRKALITELRAGKSLAQVATAHGKTAAGLKAALLQPFKARFDKAVASGRLTAAQAQTRLDRLSARLDKLINRARA
jgi:hypothetical protein